MRYHQLAAFAVLSFLLSTTGFAQEKKPAPKADAKPETFEVKRSEFRVEVKASGAFESIHTREVKAGTKQVASLVIDKIVPHGAQVRKGQPIVWFETEKVDQQLKDSEFGLRLAEIALRQSEFAIKQLMKTQELDKAVANRTKQTAQQTYDNFVKTDHRRRIASAEFSLKNSKASLENTLEELKQLEKMYKEDELTEESEEIVLKRARQQVESAKFRFEGSEIQTKRSLGQEIPREVEQQKETLTRQELAYDKSIRDLEAARLQATIELEQQKLKYQAQEEKLVELRAERKELVLTSPIDGVVYHGKLVRGRLTVTPDMNAAKLARGAAATSSQLLVTVVNPNALQVRVELEEKQLGGVKPNVKAVVIPTGFPDRRLNGKVNSVSLVPLAAGKYDCLISFQLANNQPPLMPGMTCKVELTTYEKKNAMAVPDAAVFRDDAKKQDFVYVKAGDTKPEKRPVTIGKKSDGKTEIIGGLKPGEKVLLKKPE